MQFIHSTLPKGPRFARVNLGVSRETVSPEFRSLHNDNEISRQHNSHFQNFIVIAFYKEKQRFWVDLPLCLQPPPPPKMENYIYVVVSPPLKLFAPKRSLVL